ncbi:hypothetical protein [Streptomyces morookaense]|uniref:Uncharacterized protein n=1 Tax=Streptomyces morookaense TaxID=1970 RepID=A0A7Y7B4J0_STRMO|nr:hypothetical protein [Streptomyces morookaense]NVK78730.1 hypothetical protein [Streptomyces morookaense]
MPRTLLALGAAVIGAAGCVWYLPALSDLRAGDDRPPALRTAALACLTGWGTLAAVVLLLLAQAPWRVAGAVAAVGAAAASSLAVRAGLLRRRDRREAGQWAEQLGAPPVAAPGRPGRTALAWGLSGVALAAAGTPFLVRQLLLA